MNYVRYLLPIVCLINKYFVKIHLEGPGDRFAKGRRKCTLKSYDRFTKRIRKCTLKSYDHFTKRRHKRTLKSYYRFTKRKKELQPFH